MEKIFRVKNFQWFVLAFGTIALFYTFEKSQPSVVVETTKGSFEIKLFPNKAPLSVQNFLRYVRDEHYDGTIFHRVMPGFMVQGGGLNADLEDKKQYPAIKNEAKNGVKNLRATVGMARGDKIESATDQFYVNLVDNDFLDFKSSDQQGYGYAVFGEVTSGMEVIDSIAIEKTQTVDEHKNVPINPIRILSVREKGKGSY